MYNYVLYMSFAGEISDDSDLYSLAQNATYFAIEPNDGRLLNEDMVDEMPVFRKDWAEIVIKNKPYQYKTDPTNKNKLYDLIIDNPTTHTYFLKLVNGTEVRYGYFGEVDCSINEDRSLIRVNPAIIDQYTDFIENYEKDVDVFGLANLIRNSNFYLWSNGLPEYWNVPLPVIQQGLLLGRSCAILYSDAVYGDLISQTTVTISQGNQSKIQFYYKYVGTVLTRENLTYTITLIGETQTYQLTNDGNWIESLIRQDITYKTNAFPSAYNDVNEFDFHSKITDVAPVNGNITINFNGRSVTGNAIYLTGVEVNSSDLTYIDLSLIFPSDKLTVQPQEICTEIATTERFYPYFNSNNGIKGITGEDVITKYFNENGSPNFLLLSDSKWGVFDSEGFSHEYWQNVIFKDITSHRNKFHLGEICELEVYIGNYIGSTTKRNIHGWAKFAREEWRIIDTLDETGNPIPPEEDSGWVPLDKDPSTDKRLWVRTPFNGAFSLPNTETWTLGNIIIGDNSTVYWRKLTSVKQYPISVNSKSIGTGIEFRDICRKIYRSTHNSRQGKEVYSAFFWNDSPYMDFLDLDGDLNYYTMKQNFLNHIAVVHTSEIKNISNPELSDSELKVSFKGLFDDLLVKFPALVWFVDTDMNLHFEHERFINRIRSYVDITYGVIPKLGEYKSYKFDSSKLFGNIVREDINSYYKDFKKSEETFKKITSNKRRKDKKETKRTSFISTDIMGAIENASDLGNGMVLVAYKVNDSGNNEMVYGTGQITGNDKPNGVLSTSYLLKTFGNYVGTWHEGNIDGHAVNYMFSQYCRLGSDITLKGIIQENYLLTDIGMALIKSKKYDYEDGITICTPIYRHIDWYVTVENLNELQFDYDYTDILAN